MIEFNNIFAASGALGPDGYGYKEKFWEFIFSPHKIARQFGGVISKTFTLNPQAGNYRNYLDAPHVLWWVSFKAFSRALKQVEPLACDDKEYELIFLKLCSLKSKYLKQRVWPLAWINSIGLSNDGSRALNSCYYRAKESGINLIPSVKGYNSGEWIQLIKLINQLDTVWEANLSCTNVSGGIIQYQEIEDLLKLIRSYSKNQVIIKLGVSMDYVRIAKFAEEIGINALDCFNTIPWSYLFPKVESPLKADSGGTSGWLNKEFAIEGIKKIRQAGVGLPIIGGGGIICRQDILEFKKAGANGVSLGSGVFLPFPLKVRGLIRFFNRQKRKLIIF